MKKGFTLLELLAIIILLAIIALIITPITIDVIKDAKKQVELSSVKGLIDSAGVYYNDASFDSTKMSNLDGKTNILDKIETKGDKPSSGTIYLNQDGEVSIAVVYNETCYSKSFGDKNILESNDIDNCNIYKENLLNGADPEISKNLIPVVISNDGTVTKADATTKWYEYGDKKWANAVIVKTEKQEEYSVAGKGTKIDASDIVAYYVWIPRYKYEIFTDIENILVNQDYETNIAQQINIVFENKTTTKSTGTEKEEWLTHPAFTFGKEELNGIWVGKFETTGTGDNPTILPYTTTNPVTSLRSQNVSTQFLTAQKFIKYGLENIDSHMMKNSDWGAVAYLTNSEFGRCIGGTCEEVRINNSSLYYTGCAATNPATTLPADYKDYTSSCQNTYNTEIGVLASTTGNITGIYDMSGGSGEYVMGIIEDSLNSGVSVSGRNNLYNSGFTGNLGCPTCDISSGNDSSITSITGVIFPDSKYYDLYAYGTSSNNKTAYERGHLGDATIELGSFTSAVSTTDSVTRYYSNWYSDSAYFISLSTPWFVRGANWGNGSGAGVFAFDHYNGHAVSTVSFRSVLVNN